MKLELNLASIIYEWTYRHGLSGQVLALGPLELPFSIEQLFANVAFHQDNTPTGMDEWNAKHLFKLMGFQNTYLVSNDDVVSPDVLFDINSSKFPSKARGKHNLVLDIGTLTEVFHIPNALANAAHFSTPDGAILHFIPPQTSAQRYYNISPTLFFDYYTAAGFEICEAARIVRAADDDGSWQIESMPVGCCNSVHRNPGEADTAMYAILVKRNGSAVDRRLLPKKAATHSSTRDVPRWFFPYLISNGTRSELSNLQVRPLVDFSHVEGAMWSCSVPHSSWCCDTNEEPNRSPLILLEDEFPLGPGHSEHASILKNERGYSHWGDQILFAPAEPGDPNANGKRYTALLPIQSKSS